MAHSSVTGSWAARSRPPSDNSEQDHGLGSSGPAALASCICPRLDLPLSLLLAFVHVCSAFPSLFRTFILQVALFSRRYIPVAIQRVRSCIYPVLLPSVTALCCPSLSLVLHGLLGYAISSAMFPFIWLVRHPQHDWLCLAAYILHSFFPFFLCALSPLSVLPAPSSSHVPPRRCPC